MTSPTQDLAAVLARLEKLEYRIALGKAAGVAALIVLICVILIGAAPRPSTNVTDEIRGNRFVLVDQAGKPRAVLAIGSDGTVGLYLTDRANNRRAMLGVLGDGKVGLFLTDQSGEPVFHAP